MAAYTRSFLLIVVLLAGVSAGVSADGFSFNGVSNRFITPNGDGKNENVAFNFTNPAFSSGSVKIYDLRGHLLTTISVNGGVNGGSVPCVASDTCVVWDARARGSIVSTGVYIYVLAVESVVASGALVVIR